MNSVSPSAAHYIGGVMQDELVESQRQQPLERQGSFGVMLRQTADPNREANGEPEEMYKLKAKLMSAWNNVKYGLYSGLEEQVCLCLVYILLSQNFRVIMLQKSKTKLQTLLLTSISPCFCFRRLDG